METHYDILHTKTAPYYEVVVVCSECYKRVLKCQCDEENENDNDEL